VIVLSQGDFNSPLILPKRNTLESLEKCRFVHRAISAGVETLARRPSRTTARRVEQGCEVPCLERGSGTVLRHWAKRASASGADGSVDMVTSVLKKEKGWTEYHYYVKKANVLRLLSQFHQQSTKKLGDRLNDID